MNNKIFVPDRLKKAMGERGWTVTHFCFELGLKLNDPISQSRVYNWLRGENAPDKAMVLVFAKLLEEPMSYFYKDESSEKDSSNTG